MHGNVGSVERKIRLWVVQQERNRRREAQLGQVKPRGEAPVLHQRRTVDARQRKPWS
jgi:hypothetical protein